MITLKYIRIENQQIARCHNGSEAAEIINYQVPRNIHELVKRMDRYLYRKYQLSMKSNEIKESYLPKKQGGEEVLCKGSY